MIGWVDELCRAWGRHKRWVYADVQQPMPSMMGKIMDEGQYAASHHRAGQRFDEVFCENSLTVSRAIVGIEPELLATITVRYIYHPDPDQWAVMVGQLHGKRCSVRTCWRRLHRAHCWIATRLEVPPDAVAA